MKTCEWREQDLWWESGCGELFVFDSDGPIENKFRFCPYCGGELVEGPPLQA